MTTVGGLCVGGPCDCAGSRRQHRGNDDRCRRTGCRGSVVTSPVHCGNDRGRGCGRDGSGCDETT